MLVNFLENVGCEYYYLKDVLSLLNRDFDDSYNFVIGMITYNHESQIKQIVESACCVIPNKKNIFLILSDENETPTPYEFLNQFDLIFREFNNNINFDNQRVFPIPLGYVTTKTHLPHTSESVLKTLNIRPLKERKYDIFFSGQTNLEREHCVNVAKELNAKSLLNLTLGFFQGYELNEYFDLLNHSKIALVPKGSLFTENYRYFDAYYANCIVITTMTIDTTLNDIWYYHESPAVRIDNWSQLNQNLIDSLLSNLNKYEFLNREYYKRCVSPEGVAKYMKKIIKKQLCRG
jgi:hypothetical protein